MEIGNLFIFNPHAFPSLAVGIIIILSGLYPIVYRIHSKRAFAFLCLSAGISQCAWACYLFCIDRSTAVFILQGLFFFGGVLPPALLYFMRRNLVFINRDYHLSLFFMFTSTFLVWILLYLHTPNLLTTTHDFFKFYLELTPVILISFALLISQIAFSFFLGYRVYRRESNVSCRHTQSNVLWSLMLACLALLDWLPLTGAGFPPRGWFFIAVSFLILTFIQYSPRPIYLQFWIFTGLKHLLSVFILAMPCWVLGVLLLPKLFFPNTFLAFIELYAGIACIIIYTHLVYRGFERHIFTVKYGSQKWLHSFMDDIIRLHYPEKLVDSILTQLASALRTPHVMIIMKQIDKNHYYLYQLSKKNQPLPSDLEVFLSWLEKHPDILLIQNLEYDSRYAPVRDMARSALASIGAQVFLPLVQSGHLQGVIALGEKFNRMIFNPSDIKLLERFQGVCTIAISNAYLYEHVRQLMRDLWEANNHLNQTVQERTIELEKSLVTVKQLIQDKNNFFIMASHHFRTPLTSIKAAATLIWRRFPNAEEMRLYTILKNNIYRLEKLITDIIEIVQLDNHQLEFNYSRVDIHNLIHETYHEIQESYGDISAEWSCQIEDGIRYIIADPIHLHTIFTHIFSNAFKFSSRLPLQIYLEMRSASADDLNKYHLKPDAVTRPYFEFKIRDNGEGIPEDENQAVFEAFRQSSRSRKRYQSVGVGLYIVKRIIEIHGGTVHLQSRLDEGTLFSFILPILSDAAISIQPNILPFCDKTTK